MKSVVLCRWKIDSVRINSVRTVFAVFAFQNQSFCIPTIGRRHILGLSYIMFRFWLLLILLPFFEMSPSFCEMHLVIKVYCPEGDQLRRMLTAPKIGDSFTVECSNAVKTEQKNGGAGRSGADSENMT